MTVYTDGFRADDLLEDGENYRREVEIHRESEYVHGGAHNACENHAKRLRDKLKPYLRTFQFHRRVLRNPGQEALKEIGQLSSDSPKGFIYAYVFNFGIIV
jgi:transposase-like protein